MYDNWFRQTYRPMFISYACFWDSRLVLDVSLYIVQIFTMICLQSLLAICGMRFLITANVYAFVLGMRSGTPVVGRVKGKMLLIAELIDYLVTFCYYLCKHKLYQYLYYIMHVDLLPLSLSNISKEKHICYI